MTLFRKTARCRRAGLMLAAAALLAGCASAYFQPAGPAPELPPQRLAERPQRQHWAGIVFNGQKIGFSQMTIEHSDQPGRYRVRSESAFLLRFLGMDKRVNLKSVDIVREDLQLVSFDYEYVIDGSPLQLAGERRGDALEFTIGRGPSARPQQLAVSGPVYSQAAVLLLPTHRGLALGREHRYLVFSGELQKLVEVQQRVAAYERSTLFAGHDDPAFRVETSMAGYAVRTWLDAQGTPLLEIGLNGVLISGREDESRARSYLVAASLNKTEALLDFTLVRTAQPIADARQVRTMRVALSGSDRAVPSDSIQQCVREGAETLCTVRNGRTAGVSATATAGSLPRDLASSLPVPASDPLIVATAREIAGATHDQQLLVRRIVEWMGMHIRVSPADVWTALDVLRTREAECQGHGYLYAALARALGIPTRLANGIVYSEQFGGFLFHTWAESLVDGRWVAVDPTFGALPADAARVKLVDGETLAELVPLADWVGRLKLRVLSIEHEGG
jgi:hypothetical protein